MASALVSMGSAVAVAASVGAAGAANARWVTLKFPYNQGPFPTPGSDAMAVELTRLDRVLPVVMGRVDVLEIGNEPFIESLPKQRDDRLNDFYETVARHVLDYRREHCGAD